MPNRRKRPAAPTSTATRRRAPSTSSKRRSLTRTTLRPVDVDDLLVHQVGPQQDLVGPLAERLDVDRLGAQPGAVRVERLDRRQGHEDPAPVRLDDDPGDRRIAFADRDDQVGDLADRLAVPVADRPPDHLAQVEHLPPRGGIRPARRWARPARASTVRGRGGPGSIRRRAGRRGDWVLAPRVESSSDAGWAAQGRATRLRRRLLEPGRV